MNLQKILPTLLAMLFSGTTLAAPCPPEKEDFVNFVSGANECLALEVANLAALDKPGASLLVAMHGDAGPGPLRPFIRALGIRGTEDKASFTILRPGYSTTYSNSGPGDAERRSSSGYRPTNGKDSYTAENIAAVMGAIDRLRDHYKPKKVVALGYSGGAAVLGAGLGLLPQQAPNAAILAAYPCDLQQWANSNRWSAPSGGVSPSDVIGGIPNSTRIVAISGSNDSNTKPAMIKGCVAELQAKGIDATHIETAATHDGILTTEEVKDATLKLLGSD